MSNFSIRLGVAGFLALATLTSTTWGSCRIRSAGLNNSRVWGATFKPFPSLTKPISPLLKYPAKPRIFLSVSPWIIFCQIAVSMAIKSGILGILGAK